MKINETPKYGTRRKRTKFLFFPSRYLVYKAGETRNWLRHNGRAMTLWWEHIELEEEWVWPEGYGSTSPCWVVVGLRRLDGQKEEAWRVR